MAQRAGSQALAILATPPNVAILKTLAKGPCQLVDLRRQAGLPQTTMRGQIKALKEVGVLEGRRQNGFPGNVEYELTDRGRQLLGVGKILARWLEEAPTGLLSLGSPAAKIAVNALLGGWSSNMLRALAARPLSLTELDSLITTFNYPALERRLSAMRFAGQVEAMPGNGRGTPYGATTWVRRAVAPLAAAAHWERPGTGGAVSVGSRDVEAAFLLVLPLLRLSSGSSGQCRLVAEVPGNEGRKLAGAMVKVNEGAIVSCVSRLEGDASAWASGSARDWLEALISGGIDLLEIGGDCQLATELVERMQTDFSAIESSNAS